MVLEIDHPKAGKIKQLGNPIKFSETPIKIKTPPPMLGQHTEEILINLLNYSKDEIERLRKREVL